MQTPTAKRIFGDVPSALNVHGHAVARRDERARSKSSAGIRRECVETRCVVHEHSLREMEVAYLLKKETSTTNTMGLNNVAPDSDVRHFYGGSRS